MDDGQFDRFVRTVAGLTSRRGLLGVAAALPVVGTSGLLPNDAGAKRRQERDREDERDDVQDERRKKKKGKITLCLNGQTIRVSKSNKKKFIKQGATTGPDAKATTCAGKCGNVTNNCGQAVDCGSCACNADCGDCATCNDTTGVCEPKAEGTNCGLGPRCTNNTEYYQDTCDGNGACVEGGGQNCQTYLCAGTACGESCASNADCDPSAFCNGSSACVFRGNNGESCQGNDECFSGQCCGNVCRECCTSDACTEPTAPVCFNNICSPCTSNPGDCPAGTCCNANTLQCVANCPQDEVCRESNTCGAPCTSGSCQLGEICVAGVCRDCTVFPGVGLDPLQAAIDSADAGDTLYVCAGTYTSQFSAFTINKSLTVIGAGDDAGGTLLAHRLDVETDVDPPDVTLNSLLIQGQGVGVNSREGANLTMRNCTVSQSGRGIDKLGGSLVMHNCKVLDNTAGQDGAGIRNTNGSVELNGCLIQGNSAPNGAGILTLSSPASTDSSLALNNTRVRGNTATAASTPTGAGILNVNGNSDVDISSDSAVCENTPVDTQCSGFPQRRCLDLCPA